MSYRDDRGRFIPASVALARSNAALRRRDERGRFAAAPVRLRDERGRFTRSTQIAAPEVLAAGVVTHRTLRAPTVEPAIVEQVIAQPADIDDLFETPAATDESVLPDTAQSTPPRRSRLLAATWFAAVAVLATFLLGSGIWLLTGGRFYVVSTPSMSPTVPVGSLVLTRPVPAGGPKVGEIIAFHPPSEPHTTYTHRVYKILPGPTYQTKGDLDSGPDAWVVLPKDIVGVSTHHYRGVGFIVRGLPQLALGAVVVIVMAGLVHRRRRRLTYLVGGSLVVSYTLWVVNPLVRGVFVGSGLVNSHVRALVVNTGLLPIRFAMKGASPQHASGGHPATLSAKPPGGGNLLIHGRVDLPLLGWVLLVLICATPLLIAVLVPRERWEDDAAVD